MEFQKEQKEVNSRKIVELAQRVQLAVDAERRKRQECTAVFVRRGHDALRLE